MEATLIAIFGVKDHLTTAQECARAVLFFFYGLTLLRLSGPRVFGHWSALDIIMSIIVGSAMARAMTGSAPMVGTMLAAAVICGLHVILAHGVARSRALARLIEGHSVQLMDHGEIDDAARKANKISLADLNEALRQHGIDGEPKAANVKSMTLEPSGRINVIKHDPCEKDPD